MVVELTKRIPGGLREAALRLQATLCAVAQIVTVLAVLSPSPSRFVAVVTIDPALEWLSQDPQRVAMASTVIASALHGISAADARSR